MASGLLFTACGGDDEPTSPTAEAPAQTLPEPVTTPPAETATATQTGTETETDATGTTTEPEDEGDEEPIRSEAVFTGKDGKITPTKVAVPAFIAIKVILVNADGGSYSLEIAGTRLAVGHARKRDSVDLDGLTPLKRYKGKGPQGNVVVSASAEPGP